MLYELIPYLLILGLSVIQSLFGVGLLLFGTPLFLILGFEYQDALLFHLRKIIPTHDQLFYFCYSSNPSC